jgi:hypothetical protein
MRVRAARAFDFGRPPNDEDDRALIALRHAILSNLPALTAGETSCHGLATSKAMY